ncbi:sigma-70 family RNA polymerase sigma factor [Intestinibacillus sp. Marseille-P6563]|uniref:sigma-70 family RNA polymerase sigma factor n=1 Tax=Intestinibacillus sp. Marseille-P6563 TaxID=2364792 RepID=UPI000F04C1FC|nr:sigma-70 family RNA polymerase sigma factor [Intestinibacillus sp. Marseille-P6563]
MTDNLELIRRAQAGDKEADAALVEHNNGLIWSIVRRYVGRGVEQDDLYQLACLGFLKAVRGFDGDYGTQFSTYAVPKIAGEIRRFLRDDGTVKVSRSVKEQAVRLRQLQSRMETELGREVTVSELAEAAGVSVEEVAMCEQATQSADSLQREVGEDGSALGELLGDDGIEEQVTTKLALREAMAALPEREARVIALRYGRCLTQQQCARILGVSQVQVSRLERRAVERMREQLLP